MKYTIKDFNEQFKTEADCLDYIFKQRWPDGGICKCGKTDCFHRVSGRKTYACAWCGAQISPTAGTIFHKSSTSLKSWLHAMFLMTASRNGVSAMELMRQTGVTYKTAWRMNHQIRQLMNQTPNLFNGPAEADEAYIGGKRKGKHGRGAAGKTPVIGVLPRREHRTLLARQLIFFSESLLGFRCRRKNKSRNWQQIQFEKSEIT